MPQTVLRGHNHTHATGYNGHINHNGHTTGGFSGHGHNGYAHHNGHASFYTQNGHANHIHSKTNGHAGKPKFCFLFTIAHIYNI